MDILAGKTSPGALLGDTNTGGVYVVPAFQRSYEWAAGQWSDLWADLSNLGPGREHFMGPLVLTSRLEEDTPPPEPYGSRRFRYLIDGQQRLVTLSILLSKLSRALSELETAPGWDRDIDTSLRVETTRSYKLLDTGQGNKPARLLLNEELPRKAFALAVGADLIFENGLPEGTKDAAAGIAACSEYFANRVAELRSGSPADQLIRVRNMTKAIRDRLEFVEINLNSEEDAYTIFESFNAKGRELSRADLVKNFLMGQSHRVSAAVGSRELERRVANYWAEMSKDIEAGTQTLPTFLRHLWIAKDGKADEDLVRMDTLYPRIRTQIKSLVADGSDPSASATNLKDFAEELEDSASKYVWLWGPAGQPEPFEQAPKALMQRCRTCLDGIRAFGAAQTLPVLLAALLNEVPPEDFERLCLVLEKMAITRSLGKLPPNEVEKKTRGWCETLRSDGDKAAQVTSVIQEAELLAEDAARRNPFRSGSPNAGQAKHLLLRIENFLRDGKPTERLTVGTVDLEHIYPQNPKPAEWPGWNGDSTLAGRLGNLTLLGPKANRKIKNGRYWCGAIAASFGKATNGLPPPINCCKRHLYQASTVLITNTLLETRFEGWTPQTLSMRHEELALLAEQTWPLFAYPAQQPVP